jgi:myo-inosose-2 dehydratase
MSIVRIGTHPINWSNDDLPELGGETPLETCLAEARQAGFTGIELGNKFPRDAAALGPIMAAHGLELVSGWYGAELRKRSVEEEIAVLAPHLELLAAMGAKVLVFCETSDTVQNRRSVPVVDRPVMQEAEWRPFLEKLVAVAEHTQAKGVHLAYHHHMGTVIEKAHEIDRLMEGTPEVVGLLFDTGHLTFAGEDSVPVAKRCAARGARARQGRAPRGAGQCPGRAPVVPRCGGRGCVHRDGRRLRRLQHRPAADRRGGLRRLARGRGRAGPSQGAPFDLRPPGLPQPRGRRRGRGFHRATLSREAGR